MHFSWQRFHQFIISLGLIIILLIESLGFFKVKENSNEESELIVNNNDNIDNAKTFKVAIKGAVTNPGLYEAENETVINDLLTKAVLNNDAYLDNINLSKKVSPEMTIYVFTKKEFSNINNNDMDICYINSFDMSKCLKAGYSLIVTDKFKIENENNSLININKATINELVTLPGIGEAKAKAIISYRENYGLFKSIEDLKKVKGIGDTIFDNIKNYIAI